MQSQQTIMCTEFSTSCSICAKISGFDLVMFNNDTLSAFSRSPALMLDYMTMCVFLAFTEHEETKGPDYIKQNYSNECGENCRISTIRREEKCCLDCAGKHIADQVWQRYLKQKQEQKKQHLEDSKQRRRTYLELRKSVV